MEIFRLASVYDLSVYIETQTATLFAGLGGRDVDPPCSGHSGAAVARLAMCLTE